MFGRFVPSVQIMTSRKLVTSKWLPEEHQFTWKIANFAKVRAAKDVLEQHQFPFTIGHSIGVQTKFACRLVCDTVDGKEWVGAFINPVGDIPEVSSSITMSMTISSSRGGYIRENTMSAHQGLGYGIQKLIPRYEDLSKLGLDLDGSLSLDIDVILFDLAKPPQTTLPACTSLVNIILDFEARFKEKLQHDLANMFENPETLCEAPMMVKLVSDDNREFLVNRGLLAARSPVFLSMFQTPMSEVLQGIVTIDDISGSALAAFLSFLHTGMLPIDWQNEEVIEGLTYASHKYMLQDLQQFLEQALGFVCTRENCGRLLNLAKKLGLETAEQGILKRFKDLLENASWEEMRQIFQEVEAKVMTSKEME